MKFLFPLMLLLAALACTPASHDIKEVEDKEEQEYMIDEDGMDEEEKRRLDSLKNRDMLTSLIKIP